MGYHKEMDDRSHQIKITLFITSFINFFGGLMIMGLSIWALAEKVNYVSKLTGNNLLTGTVYILLISGIVVVVISILGCIATIRENKYLLFVYFIITMLLFVTILIGGLLGYFFRETLVDTLQEQMRNSMNLYIHKKEIAKGWDYVQSKLHCCAIKGWRDWRPYPNQLPLSCCKSFGGEPVYCNQISLHEEANEHAFSEGCVDKTKKFLEGHAVTLLTASTILTILKLIIMMCSFALFKMMN